MPSWETATRILALEQKVNAMNAALADLAAKVAAEDTVIQSAVTLIQGLTQQLKDAAVDNAEVQSLAADIDAQTTALAAAIPANTPAPAPADPAVASDPAPVTDVPADQPPTETVA